MGDKPCILFFSYNPTETIGDEGEEETINEHYKLEIGCPKSRITYHKKFGTNDTQSINKIKDHLKTLGIVIVHPTKDRPIKKEITYEDCNIIIKKFVLQSQIYGGSRRRRPSRKYKKSAKRVFRKKSRSTRRR